MALPDSVHSRVQSRVAALPAALQRKMAPPPKPASHGGYQLTHVFSNMGWMCNFVSASAYS